MRKLFTLIILQIILIQISLCHSQENPVLDSVNHLYIGANFSYISIYQTEAVYQNTELYCFKDIPKANGSGYYIGLYFKFNLTPGKDSYSSILLNTNLQKFNTKKIASGDSYPSLIPSDSIIDPTGWDFTNTFTNMDVDIEYMFLNIDMLYNQRIFEILPLGVSVGLSLSYPVSTNFYQTYNIVGSDVQFAHLPEYQYLNDDRTVVLYDDEIKNMNKFIFGVKGLLNYNITLFDDLIISPELGVYYPLTKITEFTDWRITYSSLGISFMYKIN
ncbi:MAG: hypothetical protein V1779_16020 [bacterium]